VKLADVNLLIYAYDAEAPRHRSARRWLERELSGAETFAFAWVVLLGFLRLVTNPRVLRSPMTSTEALETIDGWLAQPCSTILEPTRRHTTILRDLLEPLGTAGNITTDAHLAALAIEHGAELCSSDTDFSRFPGLRWTDPLRGA
jgi:toxin-antitoxin system PIN domain toxin